MFPLIAITVCTNHHWILSNILGQDKFQKHLEKAASYPASHQNSPQGSIEREHTRRPPTKSKNTTLRYYVRWHSSLLRVHFALFVVVCSCRQRKRFHCLGLLWLTAISKWYKRFGGLEWARGTRRIAPLTTPTNQIKRPSRLSKLLGEKHHYKTDSKHHFREQRRPCHCGQSFHSHSILVD